jgi:hypothetical protein
MDCPDNKLLLDWVQGALPPGRREEVKAHVEACPVCGAAFSALQETWNALGEWKVEAPRRSLREAVLERVGPHAGSGAEAAHRRGPGRTHLLRAASLILALGLGVGAGWLVPLGKKPSYPPEADSTLMADALDALGLLNFAADSATGLPQALEPEPAANEAEGPF